MKSGNHRSRLFFFRIIHSLTPNTSSVKYSWISRKTWGKRFLHNDVFSPQVLAGTIASTCEDGCKYLHERLHVLAGVEANICGFRCSALRWRLQCTAGKVAVHCREGCTALCPRQTYQFQNASLDIGEMFPSGVKT